MGPSKTVVVLLGPTAVGKTSVSLRLAEHLQAPIVSADSRQMFREIPIGTAAPTEAEMRRAVHHFVGNLSLEDYYSASRYESEALDVIQSYFEHGKNVVIVSGGSMMYIDALCYGIDEMPDVKDEIREGLKAEFAAHGLAPLIEELQRLDPAYAQQCDLCNHARVIHALEICRQTGQPYSAFRKRDNMACPEGSRPFSILKIGLERPREELFDRINRRVTQMVEDGFIDEARRVIDKRHNNSLNTVGFKEIFAYLDGDWTLDFALERMRKNTRVYAKKQMTWFRRDNTIHWFHPDEVDNILDFVDRQLSL